MSSPSGPAVRAVEPIEGPLDATVSLPGSKSLTNRALVCAALADGVSAIKGALVADDTEAMASALRALGASVAPAPNGREGEGAGAGRPHRDRHRRGPGARPLDLDLRLSGTSSRFLLPVVALGRGRYRLDGRPPLRARPMGPVLAAIEALGAQVEPHGPGRPPAGDRGGPGHLTGGQLDVPGDTSSQYVSGLLLAAPYFREGLRAGDGTARAGRPFVDMTIAVMAPSAPASPPTTTCTPRHRPPGSLPRHRLQGRARRVGGVVPSWPPPPSAGAGHGRGLGEGSLQGAAVRRRPGRHGGRASGDPHATTVIGPAHLSGLGDVDLSAMPDMAQTLAAVAVFADGPTVCGIGFIRSHETDRIAATVRELRRCGVDAREEPDGFVVHPGIPQPARVRTYDDHRMAMSFALLGLRSWASRSRTPTASPRRSRLLGHARGLRIGVMRRVG